MAIIRCGEHRFEREAICDRINSAAVALETLGITEGDGVALMLRNDIEFFVAGQAIALIGAHSIVINWHSTREELHYILNDCGATVLVIHADLLADLEPIVAGDIQIFAVAPSSELIEAYRLDAHHPTNRSDWNALVGSHEARPRATSAQSIAIFYTSGTTGRPKGVKRGALTASQTATFTKMLSRCYGFSPGLAPETDVTTAVIGPIYHGAPNSHANFAFTCGANIIVHPKFDPEKLLQSIEADRITHLLMVPIMFARLLKLPTDIRSRYDLSSLRFVSHAAAPCPAPLKRSMIEWWGPIIAEYYGSTEMGNVTFCTATEWLAHPGTVGRITPEAKVRIVDGDGVDLPTGEVGEVLGAVDGLTDFTYIGDEEKRKAVEKFGLIAPGDIGYFDSDGFLYLCDRSSDMIISGGVNIYPAEIEAEIHKIEEVADCAVFGIPDDEFGESICAAIELISGRELSEEHLVTALKRALSSYKIPRKFIFAAGLPREDSGKIFKRKLKDPFWASRDSKI